jgi:protein-S-isoprenylcysteine O-methyltransferase Ste14
MYLGVLLGALAGLALYRVWTFAFVTVSWLAIARKARIEDRLLLERYGEAAARYQATTPAFLPRLRRRQARQRGPRAASR